MFSEQEMILEHNETVIQMNSSPLISVVVPAYNAETTIDAMISSVLRQTMADLELVICNDASTDSTAVRVEEYTDARIRLIEHQTNQGEGATRDSAIDAARGKWLAVLDADDAWEADRLERLLSAAGDDSDVMPFDNLMVCHHNADGSLVRWRPIRPQGAFGVADGSCRDVSLADYIRSPRLLIKPLIPRDKLLKSGIRHSKRKFAADSEFFIRLGLTGLRFRYLAQPLYLYRSMPGSATANAGPHLMRECLEEINKLETLPDTILQALRRKMADLRKQEELYMIAESLGRFDLITPMRTFLRNPSLLLPIPSLLARRICYVAHRKLHRGSGR